jgi:hypothetical protein
MEANIMTNIIIKPMIPFIILLLVYI